MHYSATYARKLRHTLCQTQKFIFRLSAIMAEDLRCFDLGFQFLNVEKDEKIDCQLDKISTEKKNNARFVLSEQDRN